MRDGSPTDQLVAHLRSRPKRLLITVLFGNMVVNVVFYSVSFLLWTSLEPQVGQTGVVALGLTSLVAVIIGGEVVPKNTAVSFYGTVGRIAAWPLWALQKVLLPIIYPLERVTDALLRVIGPGGGRRMMPEELEMLVRLGTREGIVDHGAGQMLTEVIWLGEVRIRELMVPRTEMVCHDLRRPSGALLELFEQEKLTAIPVYDGTMDNMLGLVHIKDVMLRKVSEDIRDAVRPIPFLPETTTVEGALRQCQQERTKTAFVVDEYGAVAGLITVEDLLEEVVGEIGDEYDTEEVPPILELEDGRYRVHGQFSLREWEDMTGVEFPEMGVDTVGGLVMTLLGRVPRAGDRLRDGRLEFEVESTDGRTAKSLLVRVHDEAEPTEEGDDA